MTSQSMDSVLSFRAVSKSFVTAGHSVQALSDIQLQVRKGMLLGIVGPDGAGKTTLLRLATGLLYPDAGEIRLFGQRLSEAQAVHSRIGYMPQRFGLYEDLTVAENMQLYADLHNLPLSARQQRMQVLMAMSGLSPFQKRLAGKLSGGMKQKLGLSCTLLSQPELLILDEPSVGVDPVSRRELWHIIEQQRQETGMTVVLSTAYMDEAEKCDQVIMLDHGHIEAQDTPAGFRRRLEGYTYAVRSSSLSARHLQALIVQDDNVVDAVIQGEALRVIHTLPEKPPVHLPSADMTIKAVAPRLEDAFITVLSEHKHKKRVDTPAAEIPQVPQQSKDPVIVVEHVDRWFGDFQAVKNLNFQVFKGEVFGLLGANGAGKTTTFRMLCGLLPVTHGRCLVAGYDFHHAAAQARARIGYMSQKFSLYAILTVMQNLTFFSAAYGLKGRRQQQRIQWAIEEFELAALLNVTCTDLSLGYKQRLSMACALMHEPEVLFLDEPTSGVDPLARREFWVRINQLALQGVTILVTTHFMEEAEYCDRLLIMRAGEILTAGTPNEIKSAVRSHDRVEPTMEAAFIALVEKKEEQNDEG